MGILERKNMTEITTDMKRLFLPTYLVSKNFPWQSQGKTKL